MDTTRWWGDYKETAEGTALSIFSEHILWSSKCSSLRFFKGSFCSFTQQLTLIDESSVCWLQRFLWSPLTDLSARGIILWWTSVSLYIANPIWPVGWGGEIVDSTFDAESKFAHNPRCVWGGAQHQKLDQEPLSPPYPYYPTLGFLADLNSASKVGSTTPPPRKPWFHVLVMCGVLSPSSGATCWISVRLHNILFEYVKLFEAEQGPIFWKTAHIISLTTTRIRRMGEGNVFS